MSGPVVSLLTPRCSGSNKETAASIVVLLFAVVFTQVWKLCKYQRTNAAQRQASHKRIKNHIDSNSGHRPSKVSESSWRFLQHLDRKTSSFLSPVTIKVASSVPRTSHSTLRKLAPPHAAHIGLKHHVCYCTLTCTFSICCKYSYMILCL